MKKQKIILLPLLLTISTHAMDLEKGEKEQPSSLLERLKESASEYDNVEETKALIKQIRKLKRSKAQKTKTKFAKWLHEQLEDARGPVIDGKKELRLGTGENTVAIACFGFAYFGLLGEPLTFPIMGGLGFLLFISWIVATVQSFKHFNQAEPIVVNNNEIRKMLKALDKVKIKK